MIILEVPVQLWSRVLVDTGLNMQSTYRCMFAFKYSCLMNNPSDYCKGINPKLSWCCQSYILSIQLTIVFHNTVLQTILRQVNVNMLDWPFRQAFFIFVLNRMYVYIGFVKKMFDRKNNWFFFPLDLFPYYWCFWYMTLRLLPRHIIWHYNRIFRSLSS